MGYYRDDSDKGRERYPAKRRERYRYNQDGFTLREQSDYFEETTQWKSKNRRFNDGDWDCR